MQATAPGKIPSQTMTVTPPQQGDPNLVLKLKPGQDQAQKKVEKKVKKPRRRVNWTEDVIDNEHMNRKKSNSKHISPD